MKPVPCRAFRYLGAGRCKTGVVDEPDVGKHGALRKSGGAGGILDLCRARRPDNGQGRDLVPNAMEGVGVLHIDDLADCVESFCCLHRDLGHRVAPIAGDQEQSHRTRLLEYVAQFVRLVGRVRRDQHQAGQSTRIFYQQPLRNIRCPNRDVLARAKPCRQREGQFLAIGQQLPIGPRAAGLALHADFDECRCRRATRGGLSQDLADRDFADDVVGLRLDKRSRQFEAGTRGSPSARRCPLPTIERRPTYCSMPSGGRTDSTAAS